MGPCFAGPFFLLQGEKMNTNFSCIDSNYNLPQTKLILGIDEVGRGPLAGPVVACTTFCLIHSKESLSLSQLFEYLSGLNITDSKKLTPKKRLDILKKLKIDLLQIKSNHFYKIQLPFISDEVIELFFVISEISHKIIDEINILNATKMAMDDSFLIGLKNIFENQRVHDDQMHGKIANVLIDGNMIPPKILQVSKQVSKEENYWGLKICPEAIVKGDSKSILIALASIIAKEYRDHLMQEFDSVYSGYNLSKHAGYPTPEHLEALKKMGPSPIHRRSFKGVLV